ncbi:hypothetical protein [Peptostreptococcus sp. D1]|uniref:hypothetical protein n=1 Tax=Peptostreptococcus sp. D1 TaxID=72304 RepID=UPI0008F362AA|nr:hypothetical protein [Peptostreptococcus sp. D1]SFE89885.1 hypothetical protein SAMN02910278_02001 [Peptostreptococcus sp. D1]
MKIDEVGKYILNKQEKDFLIKNKDKSYDEIIEKFNKKYNCNVSKCWLLQFYYKQGIHRGSKNKASAIIYHKTNSEKLEFVEGSRYKVYETSIDNRNKLVAKFIGKFKHIHTYKHIILFEGKNGIRESFMNNRQLYRFEKVS